MVNGSVGETCNIIASADELAGTIIIEEDELLSPTEDLQQVIDTFTGQEPLMKGVMVIVVTEDLIAGMATLGITSPAVYGMFAFGLWIVLAIAGLLPFVYVMLFAFVVMGILGIGFVMGRND